MEYQSCLINAIERVLGWDLPDELLADAVKDQADLLAGVNPEDVPELCCD
jgi:hypothetical protein